MLAWLIYWSTRRGFVFLKLISPRLRSSKIWHTGSVDNHNFVVAVISDSVDRRILVRIGQLRAVATLTRPSIQEANTHISGSSYLDCTFR